MITEALIWAGAAVSLSGRLFHRGTRDPGREEEETMSHYDD